MASHPLFGEVSSDFNEAAAIQVYNDFMADPDYYRALLNMHAYEVVNKTILTEPEVIDSLIIDKYNARKELVKDAILSGVINKTMSNKTVDEVVAVMDVISKNFEEYTSFERAANVKQQRRGPGGRFVTMGTTKITPPHGAMGARGADQHQRGYWREQAKAYDNVTEAKYGKRSPTVNESAAWNAAHSAAYLQVADAIHQLDPTDMMMADITYEKVDRNGTNHGSFTRTKVGQTVDDFISPDEFGSGEIPTSIKWSMDSESKGYGRFDILTGAGASTEAAFDVANAAGRSGPALQQMNQSLQREYEDQAGKKYGQLGAVASMIETVGGDRISPQGKAALGAAKYIGEYGSEAEKVLGPTARRAAYRYRGTEMKPDPRMDKAIAASVAGSKDVNDAHERLIHPVQVTNTDTVRTLDLEGQPAIIHGLDFESENEHSPFIRYWQSQLPNKKYIQLHLDSGTTPPSQGVVFDAKGQIISQSVGYGDDHYLPFNLNKLTGANRGEWVRTRTMGGPTTEDISAALLTGTRAVTVVSHSGEYVVEFDDSFRGGRRNNDKNRRMVRRYAQLLDTLDAENTTLQGIPPDRKREIRDQVASEIPGQDQRAQQARVKRISDMEAVERANPTPSQQTRAEWMEEFGQKFADTLADNSDRDEMSWKDVKANLRIKEQRAENDKFAAQVSRASMYERKQMMDQGAPTVGELSDQEALERLGATQAYKRFVQSKEAEYRAEQAPLKLNGQGYYFALQALQEQFPNAIKRVEWYPAMDDAAKDKGYVPHKFIRPQAAKEGFWNPEVEGVARTEFPGKTGKATGKTSAHHTNYQNYAARQRVAGQTAAPTQAERPVQPGGQGQQGGTQGGAHGTRTPNINPMTGVTFSNLTPNPEINNRTSAPIERRRAAFDAAQVLTGLGVTIRDRNGVDQQVALGQANLRGLPTLTNANTIDPDDEAQMDTLANEIEGLFNGRIQVEGGGAGPLREQITSTQQGQAVVQNLGNRIAGGRVKPLQSIEAAFRDTVSLWDFSSPDVRGEDFLPGGNRTHQDYNFTLNSDPDIQSIRREYLAQNGNWATFANAKTQAILSANRDVAAVASQSYRGGNTIRYAGTDYSVPGGTEELASRLVFDSLGLLKTRQLQRYLQPGSNNDPFPRPPGNAPAIGAGSP